MRTIPRLTILLILSNLFTAAAGAARPCAAQLAKVASHLARTTDVGRDLILNFRDRAGRTATRSYRLERVRVVDGQIKLRLSADGKVVTLVAFPDEADGTSATLKVRSIAGPFLGLGKDLRVAFEVP